MNSLFRTTTVAILLASFGSTPVLADDRTAQRFSLYQAHYSPDRMMDILRFNDPRITGDSRLTALAYSRDIGGNPHGLSWEVEAQAVHHTGEQHHPELNGLIAMRWNRFPWDNYANTSIAIGTGISYAFDMPELEPRTGREELESNQWLNYMLVEVDISPPRFPRWGLILRVHHRSGVFGLFNGVNGGSNFVGAGLRYGF